MVRERTSALRIAPAFIGQVALRAAVIEVKAWWVADTGRRHSVPHQHHVTPLFQQRPECFVGNLRDGSASSADKIPVTARASQLRGRLISSLSSGYGGCRHMVTQRKENHQ